MKQYIVICVAFISFMLGACQPTPDEQVIISKGEIVLSEQGDQTTASNNTFPERYKSDVAMLSDSLSIQYDADIQLPEASTYSIWSVKKNDISDKTVGDIIHILCPNAELIEKPTFTKAQLAYRISYLEDLQNQSSTEQIETLKLQLEEAPLEYSSIEFNLADVKNREQYSAYTANQDGTYSMFYGIRSGNSFCYSRNSELSILREDILDPDEDAIRLQDYQGTFPLTSESALITAQEALRALSLSDMRLVDATKVCTYYYGQLTTRGWDFTFTHWNGDLPSLFSFDTVTYGGDNLPLPTLCAPWMPEVVLVSVDEQGILCVDIRNLVQADEQVESNSTLLDVDSLVEKIETQLGFRYKYSAEKCTIFQITIREMTLCSSTVTAKDNLNIGLQIPSWLLRYDYFVQMDGTEYTVNESMYFSALDGSYIEPRITSDMLE